MSVFGSSASKTAPPSSSAVDTLIGRQTEILGDIRFSGGLHLDGRIKGNVATQGDKSCALWLSETGVIEGDVNVPNIVLNGAVTGDVRATERLTLAVKARITGNVHYKVLQMEPGAMVNGQLLYEGGDTVAALTHQRRGDDKREEPVLNLQDRARTKTA